MNFIYSEILSAIEKALRMFVKEYHRISKYLWNLVEEQDKNIAELVKI